MFTLTGSKGGKKGDRSSSAERGGTTATEPIQLNLDGIRLNLGDKCRWTLQSDDLESAAKEINVLLDEKDELTVSLNQANMHVEDLQKEVVELNDVKNVTLAMVSHYVMKDSILHFSVACP
jgi:hypothetical protein